jgi:hypothetical protein
MSVPTLPSTLGIGLLRRGLCPRVIGHPVNVAAEEAVVPKFNCADHQ